MLPRKQELDLPAPPPPPLQHGEQPSASSNNRIGAGQQVAASSYQVGAPVPAGGVSAHQQQHVTSTGRGPHGQQHPTHQMNRAQQVGVSPAKPLDDTAETKDGFTPRSEYGEDDYSDNYDNLSDGVPMGGDYTNTPLHHELMHDGRGALAGNLQNLNSGSKRLFNSKADGSCQEHVPFEGLVSKSREQSSTPGPHSGSSSASADCSSSGGKNVKQATFLDAQAQLPGEPQNINPDHAIGSSGTNSSMAAAGPPMLISGISRANAQIGQSSTANKAAPATANAGGLALGAAGAGVFDQQAPPFNVDMTNLAPPPAMNNMIPGASGMNQTGLPVPLSVSKSWGRHGATSPPPGVCPPPEPPRGMLPPGIVGGPSLLVSSSQQQGNNFPAAGAGSGGFIAAAGKHGSCTTPMNNYSDTKLPSPLHNPHNSGKGQQPLHPKQPYAESQYAGDAGAKGSPASTVGRNTTNKQRVNKRAAFAAEQQHKLPINSSQQQPPQHQQLPDVYSIPVPMPSSRQLLQPPGEASTAAMQPPNTTASATVVVDHQEPGLFPFASQQAPTLPSAAAGSCKNKPTSNNPATAAPSYHQSAPVGHQPLKPEGQLTMEVGQHLQPGSVQVLSRNQSTSYSPAENSSTKMTTSAVGAPQGGPAPPAVIAQQPPLPASMGTAATTSAAAAAAALTKQDNFQIPQNPPPPPPVVPAVPQAAIMQQDYGKSNVVNNEQGILDDFCADNTFNPANSSNIAPQFGSQLLEDSEIEPVGDQVVDHMLTEHNDGCATSTMNNILDHHNVINTNSEQENREKCMSKTSVISHLTGSSSNKNSATSMTSNGNGSDGKNGTTGGNNNTASGSAGGSGNYNQSNPTTTPAGQNITPQNPHPQYSNVFNIYADNVEEAFRELAERDYDNFIGVESFFPGLVLRPTIPVDSFLEHHYATLRSNVDCTNLIQLDLTIRRKSKDPESDAPTYKTFRFHFTYNLHNELYSVDAMRKLVEAGSFQNPTMQSKRACIDSKRFAELFMTSGLVLDEEIIWIPIYGLMIPFDAKIETLPDYRDRVAKDINPAQIFRGLYDLAHLLQVLNGRAPLPEKVDEFYKELDTFFPKRCIASFHDFTSLFFSRSNEESITTLEKFASDQQSYLQNLNKYDGKPPTLASTKFLRSSDATGFFAFPPGFSGTAGSLLGGLHGAASSGNNSSSGLLQTASSVGNILLNGASTNGTTSRRESTGTTSAPSGQHPAPGSRRAEGSATVNNSTVVNGISDTAATGENHDNTGDGNKSVMTTSDRDRGQSIATSN
ncbi:unnamed protein product [Amoebophrya sp. A120]|nr:unnamed protein product [Amoebophrya sp. A120]|eukprot:GSA120T00022446001.1